ncbi:MAG: hypothetical protein ABIJ96_08615 [Elusimicrobiota bacterium]
MRAVSILFFLSGATGLLYEVLWAKHLALVLGSTAIAQTFILTMFLAGLAIGNAVFGRLADRSDNPLALYARLEFAVAACAALSPLAFRAVALLPWNFAAVGGAVCVLAPSILLGGTLPALSRWIAPTLAQMRRGVSWLYFLNSAGAAFGALTAGFVLIPQLGIDIPVVIAAAINAAIGGAALAVSKTRPAPVDAAAEEQRPGSCPPWAIYAAVFLSGFVALSYEIGWIRLLALSLGSSTYTFSLMLGAFISGIALGSLAVTRPGLSVWDPAVLFAWAELGVVASLLAAWPFYERLPYYAMFLAGSLPRTPAAFYLVSILQWLFCFALMLLPTAFLGAALPLASRAAGRSDAGVGAVVGRIFAFNTAGNVAGAAASGLLLLPLLGIKGLFTAGMAVNLAVGLIVLWLAGGAGRLAHRLAASLVAAGLGLHLFFSPPLDNRLLSSGSFRRDKPPPVGFRTFKNLTGRRKLLFHRDGREATVTVEQNRDATLYLKLNGKVDASTGEDMRTQALLAHLPLTLKPGAQEALIVGLGSGVTAGAALQHPLKRLDVVEISRAVADAEKLFRAHNDSPLEDRRTRLHLEDAKTFLNRTPVRYDIVISEPSNPWLAGVGNLFSLDFYVRVRSRMKPGGIMVQWFHLYEMSDPVLRLVLRTFAAAFPQVTLWSTSSNDILLLGSDTPLPEEFGKMRAAMEVPAAAAGMRRIRIDSLAGLLSLQTASDAAVRQAAGAGPLNKDHFPILEYQAPIAFFLNKTSALLSEIDERRHPERGKKLLLPRFLGWRNAPLSRAELRGMIHYHELYGGFLHQALRAEWRRRYPPD